MTDREQAMVFVLSPCQRPAEPMADQDQKPGRYVCVNTCSVMHLQYLVLPLRACLHQQGSAQVHFYTDAGIGFSVLDDFALVRIWVEKMRLDVRSQTSISSWARSPILQFTKKFFTSIAVKQMSSLLFMEDCC